MSQEKSNIYLLGFMGAGKTTIGKALAALLGYSFWDTDELVETQARAPITKIFEEHGEAYFRKVESDVVRQVADRSGLVVAVGGGAGLAEDNWVSIQQSGLSVYLKWPQDVLIHRILDGSKRPLVVALPRHLRRQQLAELLSSREPAYLKADLCITCEKSQSPDAIASLIETKIGERR